MQCPIDHTQLVMADRQGVEIDYCPQCRGIWLDRNELDKIIERSTQYHTPDQRQPERQPERQHYPEHHDYDDDHRSHGKHGGHHKKESFLGELFDF